jgi:hypothetical protein
MKTARWPVTILEMISETQSEGHVVHFRARWGSQSFVDSRPRDVQWEGITLIEHFLRVLGFYSLAASKSYPRSVDLIRGLIGALSWNLSRRVSVELSAPLSAGVTRMWRITGSYLGRFNKEFGFLRAGL